MAIPNILKRNKDKKPKAAPSYPPATPTAQRFRRNSRACVPSGAPPGRAPIMFLPPELLIEIAWWLPTSELHSFARTCTLFFSASESARRQTLVLAAASARAIGNVLGGRRPSNAAIAQGVRNIVVRAPLEGSGGNGAIGPEAARALKRFPALDSLDVGQGAWVEGGKGVELLADALGRQLCELRIQVRVQAEIPVMQFAGFQHLTRLDAVFDIAVDDTRLHFYSLPDGLHLACPNLEVLTFRYLLRSTRTLLNPHAHQPFFASAYFPRLRSFACGVPPTNDWSAAVLVDSFLTFLIRHAPTLEALAMPRWFPKNDVAQAGHRVHAALAAAGKLRALRAHHLLACALAPDGTRLFRGELPSVRELDLDEARPAAERAHAGPCEVFGRWPAMPGVAVLRLTILEKQAVDYSGVPEAYPLLEELHIDVSGTIYAPKFYARIADLRTRFGDMLALKCPALRSLTVRARVAGTARASRDAQAGAGAVKDVVRQFWIARDAQGAVKHWTELGA